MVLLFTKILSFIILTVLLMIVDQRNSQIKVRWRIIQSVRPLVTVVWNEVFTYSQCGVNLQHYEDCLCLVTLISDDGSKEYFQYFGNLSLLTLLITRDFTTGTLKLSCNLFYNIIEAPHLFRLLTRTLTVTNGPVWLELSGY
jgi:hypothetical protein